LRHVVLLVSAPVHFVAKVDMTVHHINGEEKNFPAHVAPESKVVKAISEFLWTSS